MKQNKMIRRKLIKLLMTLPAMNIFTANAAVKTPKASEGPFYPLDDMRFDDIDNDLVKVSSAVKEAGGEVLHLKGRVIDKNAKPIQNARVEIWQCDANGHYLHTADNNATQDKAFQGFGHTITDNKGEYTFRTIKPVSYPGRTPHIHVKAFVGRQELTTQFYISDHPENNRDFLFRQISEEQQKSVSMEIRSTGSELETTLDIIV